MFSAPGRGRTPFPPFRLTKKGREIRGNVEKGPAERIQANSAVVPTNHGLVIVVHVDEWVSPRFAINKSRSVHRLSRLAQRGSPNTRPPLVEYCHRTALPLGEGIFLPEQVLDVDRTARPQDARRFPIQCRAVRRVACHLQKEDRIERLVWKRKPMKVGEEHPT